MCYRQKDGQVCGLWGHQAQDQCGNERGGECGSSSWPIHLFTRGNRYPGETGSHSARSGDFIWGAPCWDSLTVTSSVSSLVPLTEPVPLPDRGEERRRGEDPEGERGRGVEGLL